MHLQEFRCAAVDGVFTLFADARQEPFLLRWKIIWETAVYWHSMQPMLAVDDVNIMESIIKVNSSYSWAD